MPHPRRCGEGVQLEGTTSVEGDRRIASERRQTCVEYGADREGPDELFLVSAIDKDNWRGAQHMFSGMNGAHVILHPINGCRNSL